jgi:hypothetical protein
MRRRGECRYRPDSIHQVVGTETGVVPVVPVVVPVLPLPVEPVVVPVLPLPPTSALLSGVNRTS